jgi:integrase
MGEAPKLLDRARTEIRARHYSPRTEETYVAWMKRFILFHNKRHPASMGADEVNAFLTSLAVERRVSALTQNQALSAILFLYRHVLDDPLPWIQDIVRAARPERVPVVLTGSEVRLVIEQVDGVSRLVVQVLYGSGLRLLEALQLRVKDIDFARRVARARSERATGSSDHAGAERRDRLARPSGESAAQTR